MATRYNWLAKDHLKHVATARPRGLPSAGHWARPYHSCQSSGSALPGDTATPLKGSRVASARRRSYLAIRTFFTNDTVPLRERHPRLSFPRSLHSFPNRSRSYTTTVSTRSGGLTREEEEWAHTADLPTLTPSLDPAPRFDWRKRAPSQTRPIKTAERAKGGKMTKRKLPPPIAVQPGQPFHDEIKAYAVRFLPLLEAEQAEEEAVFKERLANWSLARLQEEGYCLTDMAAYWLDTTQFGMPMAAFSLGPGMTLPEHRLNNGTQVLISRIDPLKEPPITGKVVSHSLSQLKVAFNDKFDLEKGAWRLDLGLSNIVYERMRNAITHFNHDAAALEQSDASSPPDREIIYQGTHLRDVLLRSFSPASVSIHEPLQEADDVDYVSHDLLEHSSREPGDHGGAFKDDMRIQSWARRYSALDPVRVEGDPVLDGMNATQVRAAAMMIGERVSLVQGPPGTGKTKTIIQTVNLLKVHFQVVHPILVCTYTNVAVDNLVEGFAAAGVKPVRVAFGGQVKASLQEYTLEYKEKIHPLRPMLDKLSEDEKTLQSDIAELKKKLVGLQKSPKGFEVRLSRMKFAAITKDKQLSVTRARKHSLRQTILREIMSEADVICTTCLTAAANALNVIDFPVVFLDEASMSTEPASLIPIMKGSKHLALIGDHKQLPPIITSVEAQVGGLGISLFERLTEEGVVPSVMLDVQYRMHPSISRFPASEFYNLSLQDGTIDAAGNIPSRLLAPSSSSLEINEATGHRPSVVFLDHASSESMKDRSRVNHNEGSIVCSIVEDLLLQNPDLQGKDIGIIAPYAAQISLLTRMLNQNPIYRKRFEESLGSERAMQLANVEIKTVDGFEGREKDVIIFSTVRCNRGGYIGFLADRRRLNVGLTRAKRGLFVVGNMGTLKAAKTDTREGAGIRVKGGEVWRRYVDFLEKEGMVIRLKGERLEQLLYGNGPRPLTQQQVQARIAAAYLG